MRHSLPLLLVATLAGSGLANGTDLTPPGLPPAATARPVTPDVNSLLSTPSRKDEYYMVRPPHLFPDPPADFVSMLRSTRPSVRSVRLFNALDGSVVVQHDESSRGAQIGSMQTVNVEMESGVILHLWDQRNGTLSYLGDWQLNPGVAYVITTESTKVVIKQMR